jgi:proteic killer suppression protein
MDVFVKDKKLRRALEDDGLCKRRYGADMAKKLRIRVASLSAAESLADFWPPKSGPERCHELQGQLVGTFSVDLNQPYRLLFTPIAVDPNEKHGEGRDRWKSIKSIEILKIEDTHG